MVGGASSRAGYVYATNPRTNYFGPVCDDDFDENDVSNILLLWIVILSQHIIKSKIVVLKNQAFQT